MANDTITVTYKVNDDGSLERITKRADKAAAATDNLNKKKNTYNRQEKGVAGITSNSTKAFSKQAQTVGGTLVPAYAVLASNVFALTAAFGILQRSGGVQKLEEGLKFTGRAAGQNLPYVADRLREITGAAVSTADAMKSVAVGISAGFSQSQMEGLTKVAKGASLALGRDMADAMDRLTRGAAKLEPEILDELGILVRLDEVSRDYAASVGKSVNALSSFEKRMAFTNAIIDQGTKKFGNLSKAIDENPYNKLAASLTDITQTLLDWLSVGLNPLVSLLASSPMALVGIMVLFGSTILKQLIPAMDIVISRQKDLATAAKASAQKASKVISKEYSQAVARVNKAFKTVPASVKKMEKELKAGTQSTKQLQAAIASLTKSEKLREAASKRAGKTFSNVKRQELLDVKALKAELTELQAIERTSRRGASAESRASGQATASGLTGRGLGEIDRATTLMGGFAKATKYSGLQLANVAMQVGIWNKIAVGARAATGAVTLFGRALLNAIPIIGQVLFIGSLLYPLFQKIFSTPTTLVSETMKDISERMQELNNVTAQMVTTYLEATTSADRFFTVLNASTGVTQQANDALNQLIQVQVAAKVDKVVAARKELHEAEREQAAVAEGSQESELGWFRKLAVMMAGAEAAKHGQIELSQDMIELTRKGGYEADKVRRAEKKVNDAQNSSAIALLETKEGMVEILERELATYEVMKQVSFKNAEEVELLNAKIEATSGFLKDLGDNVAPEEVLKRFRAWNIEQQNIANSAKAAEQHVAKLEALFAGPSRTGEFSDHISQLDTALKDMAGGSDFEHIIDKYSRLFQLFKLEQGDIAGLKALNAELKDLDALTAGAPIRKADAAREASTLDAAGLGVAASIKRQGDLNSEISLAKKRAEQLTNTEQFKKAAAEEARITGLRAQLDKERNREVQARIADQTRLGGSGMGAAASALGYAEMNKDAFDVARTSEKVKMLSLAAQPMMEELKKLGPQGELLSTITSGAFAMQESFHAAFESIDDGGSKMQAGLAVAATAVNQIGSIMAASSKARIAGIDQEIAAEKKRDGKSKESVARIAALERKKEKAARKAFEVNKKMQMASAVISTASAVMGALAWDPKGPWNLPIAAMIGAMGAAQLAIIAGTSFQGGGSGGAAASAAAPSAISMGSRNNKVDISSGRGNAAGELAYLRGARGSGSGARDFRPAFAGGYVVGEQGPELFMPGVPGQIIPSGQGAGGQTNITFNISAVDAAGVEEVLIGQRGNIIGMIRESANEYGTDFLEDVETEVYTDTTEGTVYGRA